MSLYLLCPRERFRLSNSVSEKKKPSNTCIHLACTRKLEQVSLLLCAAEGHIKQDTWLLVKTEDPGVQAFFCQPLHASLGWYHPASHDIREYFSCSPYQIYWLLEKKIVVHITTFQLLSLSWCKFNKKKKKVEPKANCSRLM